jgi:hypothetical protein
MKTIYTLTALAALTLAAPAFAQSTTGAAPAPAASGAMAAKHEGRATAVDPDATSNRHSLPSNNPSSANPSRSNGS